MHMRMCKNCCSLLFMQGCMWVTDLRKSVANQLELIAGCFVLEAFVLAVVCAHMSMYVYTYVCVCVCS